MKLRTIGALGFAAAGVGCTNLLVPVTQTPAPTASRPAPEAAAAAPAASTAPANLTALRDWTRDLAREHCGTCHIASLPTAKPAALAIYNLDAPDWSSTLSPQRLRAGFTRRLNGKLDAAGQQRLRDFVETEIAARAK
jgi:mono/diheme cytochrome c family protein